MQNIKIPPVQGVSPTDKHRWSRAEKYVQDYAYKGNKYKIK